jgi:hypothetical protein
MTCPECGSQPQQSAAFCTVCGADLLSGRASNVPGSVGCRQPEPAETPGRTTGPILGVQPPASSDTAPVHPLREPSAHPPRPVREMVGSERTAWIDSVWGPATAVQR